jgi:hypothetical protein
MCNPNLHNYIFPESHVARKLAKVKDRNTSTGDFKMLIDIYARSMMTATRHDCVRVRDMPTAAKPPHALPAAYTPPERSLGVFAKLLSRSREALAGRTPFGRGLNQPVRCIDLQKL